MADKTIPTEFAPATRSPRANIRRQADLFKVPPVLKQFSNAVADMMLVLNEDRQIVHANRYICDVFNVRNEELWLGLRPGEAMHCVHAFETDGGCGTTKFCRTCGAVRAILASQEGSSTTEECRITQEKDLGALDLSITATPFRIDGEEFTVFSARDITGEKRRDALERIFFHDVLNTAGGVKGYLECLEDLDPEVRKEFYREAKGLMKTLIDEIVAQQDLIAAEKGELELERSILRGNAFLNDLITLYADHEVAEAREVELAEGSVDAVVSTDRRLLHRVVGNMMKNALEATEPGGIVTVGCTAANGSVTFSVHNETEIPEDVRLQLFQRSFSTKGKGRGLGTYSIRLLGEKYLGGRIGVESGPRQGTTFSITLPAMPH